MQTFIEMLDRHADQVVDAFYAELTQQPKARRVLDTLDAAELDHLKRSIRESLLLLAKPDLSETDHAAMAQRIGHVHALIGLGKEELVHGCTTLFKSIERQLGPAARREDLSRYARRLAADLAHQLQAYQNIQNSQQEALLNLTRAVWEEDNYTNFIERITQILAQHEEISACAVGRPDEHGVFFFEAVKSRDIDLYYPILAKAPETTTVVTHAEHPRGQGSVGVAWRNGTIERIVNYRTDPRAAPWRELVAAGGPRSAVAIPISAPGQRPIAVLLLFCALPGGFAGAHQTAFVDMIRTLLGCAASTLQGLGGTEGAIPVTVRQHWAALVRMDSLQMHYQPICNLPSGRVSKVEALARLRDGDQVLMPEIFLNALTSDDLFELYRRGLLRALADRNAWRDAGRDLAVSINLPPAALNDARYYEATAAALAEHACPAARLTLEVLENEGTQYGAGQAAILRKFAALGVLLAQDDLGSGHSGLMRLREIPFDWIKIDRSLMIGLDDEPLQMLRFVHQLVRLCHALGKQVLAEGIEDRALLDALAILGIDAVQGFVVSKALPPDELLARIELPALPGPSNPAERLARLAQFLVWEARLLAIAGIPDVSAELAESLLEESAPFAGAQQQRALAHNAIAALLVEGRFGSNFVTNLERLASSIAARAA